MLGSGSLKKIYAVLRHIITIESQIIDANHQNSQIIPPIAGQIRKAVPKVAPIIPIFLVFSSGFEISETYA